MDGAAFDLPSYPKSFASYFRSWPSALNGTSPPTMSSPSDNINFTPSAGSQGDFGRLRVTHFSNEFPHDNLHHLLRRLWNHGKDRAHPLLAIFIAEATFAVREEIRSLSTELMSLLPAFQNVLEFADYPELRRGPLAGSIDGVLLSAVELAAFIGYAPDCRSQKLIRAVYRHICTDRATTATTRITLMNTVRAWLAAT